MSICFTFNNCIQKSLQFLEVLPICLSVHLPVKLPAYLLVSLINYLSICCLFISLSVRQSSLLIVSQSVFSSCLTCLVVLLIHWLPLRLTGISPFPFKKRSSTWTCSRKPRSRICEPKFLQLSKYSIPYIDLSIIGKYIITWLPLRSRYTKTVYGNMSGMLPTSKSWRGQFVIPFIEWHQVCHAFPMWHRHKIPCGDFKILSSRVWHHWLARSIECRLLSHESPEIWQRVGTTSTL